MLRNPQTFFLSIVTVIENATRFLLPSPAGIEIRSCFISCRFMTEFGRYNYVTPTSYLELISSIKALLGQKRGEVLKLKKRYEVGLEKLAFAASQVQAIPAKSSTYSHVVYVHTRLPLCRRSWRNCSRSWS